MVRGIFDWSNTRKGTDNEDDSDGEGGTASDNRELDWLDTIERFGSRSRGDIACPVDGETVAGRCANQLKSASQAFLKMAGPGGPAIAALDISNLTKLRSMFSGAAAFDENIGGWDTTDITDMGYMFREASAFNHNLNGWVTDNVFNMERMFFKATAFDGLIGNWNTGLVRTMNRMFNGAKSFNQDISDWNTDWLKT